MIHIICFLFVALCMGIYFYEKEISIAFVNAMIWTSLAILANIFRLPTNELAYLFVFACTIFFSFSYLLIKRKNSRLYSLGFPDEVLTYDYDKYKKIISIIAVFNVISILIMARNLGFTLSTFTSIRRLKSRMNFVSSLRYSEDNANIPFVSRIINALVYASMGYSGYYFSRDKKFLHLINLILIVAETVILNTKATLVFGLAFWGGGYLTGLKKIGKRLNLNTILFALFGLIGVLFFTALINYLRHRGVRPYITEFRVILYSYFIGPFSAFSIWFPSYDGRIELGANTFACIFRWLGIKAQEHGEAIKLSGTSGTNVYTIFKHLLNDYSFFGTIIISSIIGFVSGVSMQKINSRSEMADGISIVVFSIILCSFFSSMLRYTTNLVACILILLVPVSKHITFGGRKIL